MNGRIAWLVLALGGLSACGDDTTADGSGGSGGGSGSTGSTAASTGATTATSTGATSTGATTTGAGGDASGGGSNTGGDGSGGGGGEAPGTGGAAALPEPCPDEPVHQSPAVFGPDGVELEVTETCDTEGSEWIPCHQHFHCAPEHTGDTICSEADCEVHTVHRKRKDGGETAEVEDLHEGTVGGNCEPAEHDLMVRAGFISFAEGCEASAGDRLTYCGSATGNDTLDVDEDGEVTCEEAGINPTSVRWCIEAECVCLPGGTPQELEDTLGELEATKEQGCGAQ
jgi:hypothetical protein